MLNDMKVISWRGEWQVYMTLWTELSGTVPLSVLSSRACVVGSMVTLVTLLESSGLAGTVAPFTEAFTLTVYTPPGAAVPALVVPSHVNVVRPEGCGDTSND